MKSNTRYFISIFLLLLTHFTFAQTAPQRSHDSKEIISQGIGFYEKGEYKEAARVFNSIHRNDTSYLLSLYEKALSLQVDSQFNEALKTINLALQEDNDGSSHDYLTLKANILDDMGNSTEALSLYDSILKIYPASIVARSQKITTLYRLKRYDEAEVLARECVVMNYLNPLYHYKLGYITYQQGNMVPSLMAMMMAQIVQPTHGNLNRVLAFLSSICNAKDEAIELQQKRTADYPDQFSRVEQIIFSKIALDKEYKTNFNLDDKVFKQVNVMMEKLEFDENSDDPYMQLYVPFFKQVFQDKRAEVMLNHAFSGLEIAEINSYMKKNKSDITEFKNFAYNYCQLVRTTRTVSYSERMKASPLFHFDDNRFFGNGKIENEKGEGDWKFYFPDGHIKAEGKLVANEKEGRWKFYYENGQLQSDEQFSKGLSDGPAIVYYQTGAFKKTVIYKNDKVEGLVKTQNLFGIVTSEENYQNGELHGKSRIYYNDGRLKSEFSYKEGKLDGSYTMYYPNQAIQEQGAYVAEGLDGTIKQFYNSGQLKAELQYSQGKTTGTWKYFHRNGQLYYQLNMTEKGTEGEVIYFTDEGKIDYKYTYKEGIAVGTSDYYHKGKVYVSYRNNNKGKTSEVRYLDSAGNELLVNKRSGKNWTITYFNPYRIKTAEKTFDQQENLMGDAVYYNSLGLAVVQEPYTENELNGTRKSWYYNRQLKDEIEYKNDKRNGTSKTYFANGQLSTVSFYDDDVLQDYQYDYNSKGILQSVYYFADGDKDGYARIYYPNGKLNYEEKYTSGWIEQVTQYDTAGRPLPTIRFENGKGIYKLFYPNGKTYFELPLEHGVWEGIQKSFFPNGNIMSEITYKNDKKEGPAKYYYISGKVSSEGSFFDDVKVGRWKSYDEKGFMDEQEDYVEGNLNGTGKYYEDGKLTREIQYKDGEREGVLRCYGNTGELAFELYYEDGLITSYSYLDKNKKLLPAIQLKNFTGVIETYYSSGIKSARIEVAGGYYHGKYSLFNEKGTLVFEATDEYGFANGETKTYYDNGQLKTVSVTERDINIGVAKEYFPDGKLKSEASYEAGNANGPHKIYDQTGKLIETRIYYHGYIMDIKK